MSSRRRRIVIRWERDLERFLVENPQHLGLLIIGWQVKAGPWRRIDLLGIDEAGDLHIIEVKRNSTTPEVIAQVLDYLHWARRLNRAQIIAVAARRPLSLDLPTAFEKRFGHPLPAVLNNSPVIKIIAKSFDPRTWRVIELLNEGPYSVTALRYVENHRSIDIAPYSPDEQLAESKAPESRHPARIEMPRQCGSNYGAHDDVREFWATHAPLFVGHFVPFRVVYGMYEDWRRAEEDAGSQRRIHQEGLFGRQMVTLIDESHEWIHADCPLDSLMHCSGPVMKEASNWESPFAGPTISGYLNRTGMDATCSCTRVQER
jgi:hypothetical protein